MEIEAGREYPGDVVDLALPSCHGVMRLSGMVVFVPGTVPGDRVRIRVARTEKRFAYGEVVSFEVESSFRVRPPCPHYGICGGCGLQALSYGAQLRIKENYLGQVLKRIGGSHTDRVSDIVPSVDELHYRGKAEFSFGLKQGRTVIGLSGRSSPFSPYAGRVVPVEGCLLFSPVASRVIPVLNDAVAASGLAPYDEATGRGDLKRLVLKEAKGTGELMLHLVAAYDEGSLLHGVRERLSSAAPTLASVYATGGGATGLLWGRPAIEEVMSALRLRIYPLSFFQPNPKTAFSLYARLAELPMVRDARRVLGLYCGAGSIELFLARTAGEVTGIDSSGESIEAARENAAINGVSNCRFLVEKAERSGRPFSGKVDLLVIDPPRRGMTSRALAAVAEIGPERIAYISCNPPTLARDLKALGDYRAVEVIPFDFFPHTAHFEVLTLLERR